MTAPPAVLLPGMLCDASLWDGVRDAFGPATVDVPLAAPSIGAMAEDVLAATSGTFVLAGLSLGAIVGFEVLRRAPERVAAFCAISTNAAAPRPEQLATWQAQTARVSGGEFEPVVRSEILPAMFASADPPAGHAERFLAMARRTGPARFRAQLAAQATRVDAHIRLARARMPALVLCGSADALCPERFHRRIAGALPAAELKVLRGAGHLLPVERPSEVASALRGWLARLPEFNLS